VPSTVTLPTYSTTPWSAGITVRASAFPVAGLAQMSSCEPPIQTAPPLTLGSEARPAPAPWVTRDERVRSPPGANQTHSDMPVPAVPHTPPEVAIRFPPSPPRIAEMLSSRPVPAS
jgi:hypothetical protein